MISAMILFQSILFAAQTFPVIATLKCAVTTTLAPNSTNKNLYRFKKQSWQRTFFPFGDKSLIRHSMYGLALDLSGGNPIKEISSL